MYICIRIRIHIHTYACSCTYFETLTYWPHDWHGPQGRAWKCEAGASAGSANADGRQVCSAEVRCPYVYLYHPLYHLYHPHPICLSLVHKYMAVFQGCSEYGCVVATPVLDRDISSSATWGVQGVAVAFALPRYASAYLLQHLVTHLEI